jgi:hypothetical protein
MTTGEKSTGGMAPRLLALVLALLLIVAAGVPLVATIQDPDFFWHLQTGRWIWEHRSLPQEFLFSLTAPETMNDTQRVTMTSYWVVQVLYHLLSSLGGLRAIALLRVALMALLVGTLFLRRSGRNTPVFLGATLLGVILLRIYPFERPQIFSFVFFSLLLLALDRLRSAPPGAPPPRAALLAVPLLMLAWANCHGAFIVGQGVLLLYLAAEGFKFAHPALGPLPASRYRWLLGAGAAGILAGFVNPNTYHVHLAARLPGWTTVENIEYQSSLQFFQSHAGPLIPIFWFLLAAAAVGFVLTGRKTDITRLALVVGTGIIAFGEIRHLPFFLLSAVPVLEDALSGAGAPGRAARAALVGVGLAAGLYLLPGNLSSLRQYRGAAVISTAFYPTDAADFLETRSPRGNLYNFSSWGGYLLWRLSPTKIFIDGRNSSQELHLMNQAVEAADNVPAGRPPWESALQQFGVSAASAGEPPWKSVFRTYGIRYAVLPVFNPLVGNVMALLFALESSPDWVPVFAGLNSVVFVEATADNPWVQPLSAAARREFLEVLVDRCRELNARFPGYPFAYIARGDLLFWLGRHDEARAAYESASRLVPRNQLVLERLASLRGAQRRAAQ